MKRIIALGAILLSSSLNAASLIDLQEVTDRLTGVLDSSAQSLANPQDYVNVRLTSCSVNIANASSGLSNEVFEFLYVEQAVDWSLERPYRQRVYAIVDGGDQVVSRIHRIIGDESVIGLCQKPWADRVITADKIEASDCSVGLNLVDGNYVGTTPAGGCPTSFNGAVTATTEVSLSIEGVDSWDRGYDANGMQVWGPTTAGYQFRKTARN